MTAFHFVPALAAVTLNAMAAGGPYRWVDAQGGVHYGDQPPAGVSAELVGRASPPGSGDEQKALEALSKQRALQETEQAKQLADLQQQRSREEVRKAACADSRGRRERLERPRQLEIQADGSAVRLTEDERQDRIRETDKRIAEACTNE